MNPLSYMKTKAVASLPTACWMRFPPVYGSSFIELADFNNDQFPDLLYSNGDNGDYSPVSDFLSSPTLAPRRRPLEFRGAVVLPHERRKQNRRPRF